MASRKLHGPPKEASAALRKLASRLYPGGEEAFIEALLSGKAAVPAVVADGAPEPGLPPVVRRRAEGVDGYPLDLSSAFALSPLLDLPLPESVLDVCAAPGGKSVILGRWFRPGRHVANEVVPKRARVLAQNLERYGIAAEVTNLPPAALEGEFALVLVDAPCSGQSLLAKGEAAPGCFLPHLVQGCAKRQRAILREVAPRVAPGGVLLYATCTFAPEENEETVNRFLKEQAGFSPLPIPASLAGQTSAFGPGVRLSPQEGRGAGTYACALMRHH